MPLRPGPRPIKSATAGHRSRPASAPDSPEIRAGRPKGARNLRAVLAAAARELMEIKENDRLRRVTKLEASVKQFVNRAAKGEERATRDLLDRLEALESRPAPEAEGLTEDDAAVIADLVHRIRASSP